MSGLRGRYEVQPPCYREEAGMCRETLEMRPALATALRPSAAAASEGRAQRRRTCRLLPLAALWVRSQAARQNPVSDKISANASCVNKRSSRHFNFKPAHDVHRQRGILKNIARNTCNKSTFFFGKILITSSKNARSKSFFFKILHKEHILIFFYTQRKEK